MLKKNNLIFIFLFLFLLSSCGFKKINRELPFVNIQKIIVNGDRIISYRLRNNIILISNDNAKSKYNLDLKIKKKKTNKIKNMSGQVTRYTAKVDIELIMINLNNQKKKRESFTKKRDYDVDKIHSETINNEKRAYETIIEELSEEIIDFISLYDKS
jgi:outer membrane lipopolysaccharide assembly protein LptE/RlpB